uniref:Replication protein n=1 Tax=Heterorhabditis bacteriophora TaxID=37862 RepID=A0A1I7WKM4_HETBA
MQYLFKFTIVRHLFLPLAFINVRNNY